MSDAEREFGLAQREPQDKDRRAGAEPQALIAPLRLVSDRTAKLGVGEWRSAKGAEPEVSAGAISPLGLANNRLIDH